MTETLNIKGPPCLYCNYPMSVVTDLEGREIRRWCPNKDCAGNVGNPRPARDSDFTERDALAEAIKVGAASPCAKSKRGVVVFHRRLGLLSTGHNAPPPSFACDGTDRCRDACGRLCIHAELDAILSIPDHVRVGPTIRECEMLHVKVVDIDGRETGVSSGGPRCWQCSRAILRAGLGFMWLLRSTGLQRYTAEEFHLATLRYRGLPVIRSTKG